MGRVVHPHIITPDRALGGSIIERSVKFDGVNDYFTRTPSVNGNRQKYTLSLWVKRGDITVDENHFMRSNTWNTAFRFDNEDRLHFYASDESYTMTHVRSTARFRDMGTWYHCVAVVDTTHATTSSRVKIYINGEQITSLDSATYPLRYVNTGFNQGSSAHTLGGKPGGTNERLHGYLAEVHMIDGQALDPSYFGYTDFQTGAWRPKKYSGNHANVNTNAVNDGSTWSGGSAKAFDNIRIDDNANQSYAEFTGLNGQLDVNFSTAVTVNSSLVLNMYGSIGNTNNHVDIFINDVERTITVEDAYGGSNSGDFAIAFTGTMNKITLNAKNSANNGLGMIIVDGEILTNGYNARGNNSFYLPFTDNSGTTATTIGRDYSGNGNNFTPTSIATTDSVLDTPSNSFAVLNPQLKGPRNNGTESAGSFTNANTKVALSGTGDDFSATLAVSSGKWYHEVKLVAAQNHGAGWTLFDDFTSGDFNASSGGIVNADGHLGTAESGGSSVIVNNGSSSSASENFADNDIIGYAFDIDGGRLSIYRNGTLISTITGIAAGTYVPIVGDDSSTDATLELNFGAHAFSYTPPTGFLPLSTKNITTSETKILNPKKHFDVVTYAGNSNNSREITLDFQPDLVWMKNRGQGGSDGVSQNMLFDSMRIDSGNSRYQYMGTNNTSVDATNANGLQAFTANGFKPGSMTRTNESGNTFVAWCWKAGGAAVSNSDGTITSQVSANTEAGFSIVSYTGNEANNATVGHGLGKSPDWVIVKDRDTNSAGTNWYVFHSALSSGHYVKLNATSTTTALSGTSNGGVGSVTSTTFNFVQGTSGNNKNVNENGDNFIAYCWAEVPGYSKFGSYIGTGNAEGPHVFTGFKPAWVLTKRISGGTSNWNLFDYKRPGYNPTNDRLFPNLNSAETNGSASDNQIRILSTGFKMTGSNVDTNGAGSTYIYMAFAQEPTFTPYGTQSNASTGGSL